MPLEWRATWVGDDLERNAVFRVRQRRGRLGGKFEAMASDGTVMSEHDTEDQAKQACEEAYKSLPEATEAPQAAAEPPPAPKAPEPPRPASAPPAPAHRPAAHQPPHKGTRR